MKRFFKKVKHLIEYLVFLSLLKILKLPGIDKSASICSFLARKIGPILSVTKVARKNLTRAFGDNVESEKIIDEVWDNFGRFIGEFPYISTMPIAEVDKRVEVVGLKHLKEFKKNNQPFLLFTGHFANWDLVLRVIYKFYPKFGIVYRRANNPYVDKIISGSRDDENIHLIAKGPSGAKDLIKALKNSYSIAMLVDQKMNDGIEVPFFGEPAMTSHAIAKFALQFNYPIIPVQIIRTKGSYFKVVIHPPMKLDATSNKELDCYNIMLKINQILENWIKERPGQWFWFHNRWK